MKIHPGVIAAERSLTTYSERATVDLPLLSDEARDAWKVDPGSVDRRVQLRHGAAARRGLEVRANGLAEAGDLGAVDGERRSAHRDEPDGRRDGLLLEP